MFKIKYFSFIFLLIVFLLFTGFSCKKQESVRSRIFFDYFDTVTVINSYSKDETEGEFQNTVLLIKDKLEEIHKNLDIYNEYPSLNNLRTLNKNAGLTDIVDEEVQISPFLLNFLKKAKSFYYSSNGEMNIMLGPVIKLWKEAQETGASVDFDNLKEAFEHTDIESLVIDEDKGTAYIKDKDASIDVGAVGKGFACFEINKMLKELGKTAYVVNIGGNLCVCGDKNGEKFIAGIQDPQSSDSIKMKIQIEDLSVVTSGSYERNGHIIDKDTLYPASYFESVTVVLQDSLLADCLSTALFCMPYEEGLEFAASIPVLWVFADGSVKYNQSFSAFLVN